MDFNDIQSAWNSDKPENVELPINLEKLKSANMPIDKVRKKLRSELFVQLATMIGFGFIPMLNWFPVNMASTFYIIYSVMVAISIYYLGKLFFFYKRLDKTSLNTKDSLYETYYDIKLNMELYKTFTNALVPFVILIILIFYSDPKYSYLFNGPLSQSHLLFISVKFIVAIILVILSAELWVEFYYGKYVKQIRKILDELREE
ncbi:MAG: hypothetical protein H7Z76_08470 [Methylotenera sp.]|nr:hypothetical protein [Flavobacterium sp.]